VSPLDTVRIPRPPAVPRTAGICRICDCTDHEGCLLNLDPLVTCSWAESDLCTRCHSLRRPTRRQVLELQRIRYLKGPIRVTDHPDRGWLTVHLVGLATHQERIDAHLARRPPGPSIDLDPQGGAHRRHNPERRPLIEELTW
jgi:hypothetical protein